MELDAYIKDPDILTRSKNIIQARIADAEPEDLKHLWSRGTGTCTCWCVHMASLLTGEPSGLIIGDDGMHRAAWTDSGIIIDSSAMKVLDLRMNESHTSKFGTWHFNKEERLVKYQVCKDLISYTI